MFWRDSRFASVNQITGEAADQSGEGDEENSQWISRTISRTVAAKLRTKGLNCEVEADGGIKFIITRPNHETK